MRKLKLLLWILMGSCALWGLLSLIAPDLVSSLSHAPVNIGNAVIVAVASEFDAEPMFVLSANAADHVQPFFTWASVWFLILSLVVVFDGLARLKKSEQQALSSVQWERSHRHAFVQQVRTHLTGVPGESLFDKLDYAVDCCDDFETACELLGVEDREELLPAIEKLLTERPTPPLDPPKDPPSDLKDAVQS